MSINGNDIFDENKKMITMHVKVHPDDAATLDDSVRELIELGVSRLMSVTTEESDTTNWILSLTDEDGYVYYLELSEYGSIILLRKDGPAGDLIYYILQNDVETIPLTCEQNEGG